MLLVEAVVFGIFAYMVNVSIVEIFVISNCQYFVSCSLVEEFTLVVEKLQSIPLTRIVACGDDDTAVGIAHCNSKFGGWCGCKTDVNNIIAHAHEGSANDVANHLTADASVATNNNLVAAISGVATDVGSVSSCELYNIQWVECITRLAANGATNTGNRFNQCHSNIYNNVSFVYLPRS